MDTHFRIIFAQNVSNQLAEEIVATEWRATSDGNFAEFIKVTADENGAFLEEQIRAYNLHHVLSIVPLAKVQIQPTLNTLPMIEETQQAVLAQPLQNNISPNQRVVTPTLDAMPATLDDNSNLETLMELMNRLPNFSVPNE